MRKRMWTWAAIAAAALVLTGTARVTVHLEVGAAQQEPKVMGDPYKSSDNFLYDVETGTCPPGADYRVVGMRTPETRRWVRHSARYWFFTDRTKPADEAEGQAFLLRVSMYERFPEWDAYFVDKDRDGYVDEEFWSAEDFRLRYRDVCAAWAARAPAR